MTFAVFICKNGANEMIVRSATTSFIGCCSLRNCVFSFTCGQCLELVLHRSLRLHVPSQRPWVYITTGTLEDTVMRISAFDDRLLLIALADSQSRILTMPLVTSNLLFSMSSRWLFIGCYNVAINGSFDHVNRQFYLHKSQIETFSRLQNFPSNKVRKMKILIDI